MSDQFLPKRVDANYRGHEMALWLFGFLMLMKVAFALNSIFNGYAVASATDGIPLETFTPAGTQTVVALFALLGLWQLVLCVVGILVLVRYRVMVPFMFALLLLQHLSKELILRFIPVPMAGSPSRLAVNLGLLALLVVGLGLSVRRRDTLQVKE